MDKLVIYDSLYGNTEKVAQEIAKSLSTKSVRFSDVKSIDTNRLGLLVVGSPTQGGRATAELNQFLTDLSSKSLENVQVAVFDTRFQEKDLNFALKLLVRTIDYAAPKMAKLLISKGATLLLPPEGFIVKGKKGPLAPGEIERAATWLKKI